MANEYRFVNLLGAVGKMRREQYEGREHLIVPVVALVEGAVRAMNAKGYEMVRADKFGVAPFSWNGRPLMAGHPVENGLPISANDPRVLSRSFGRVHNTKVEGKRLLMEAWIDVQKAKSMPESARVLERCEAHERGDKNAEPLEVSVGAGVTLTNESGQWKDREWRGAWDMILPDHLALLAETEVGACSVAMGCGALRAAMLTEDGITCLEGDEIQAALETMSEKASMVETPAQLDDHGIFARMKARFAEFLRLAQSTDEMNSLDLTSKLGKLLQGLDPEFQSIDSFWPVNAPSYVIYSCRRARAKQPMLPPYPDFIDYDYYTRERGFKLDKKGIVTLEGDSIEVTPVVRWDPIDGAVPENDLRRVAGKLYTLAGKRHSATDEQMIQQVHDQSVSLGATCAEPRFAEAHECACKYKNNPQPGDENMDRKVAIAALAAHPHSAIKDVAVLDKLDDATLVALQASADATTVTLKAAKDSQAVAEVSLKAAQDALTAASTAPISRDRWPADLLALADEREAAAKVESAELVAKLKVAQSAYTEDELKTKPLVELRKLAGMMKVTTEEPAPVASFMGRGVPRAASEGRKTDVPDGYAAGITAMRSANGTAH